MGQLFTFQRVVCFKKSCKKSHFFISISLPTKIFTRYKHSSKMVTTRASSRGASVGPEFAPEFHTELPTIPSTPSTRKRSAKAASSSSTTTASAKKRRLSVQEPKKWHHAPSTATVLWLAISLPLVAWDSGYVLGRPHTMPGGAYQWPLYMPYALYGQVDHVYGLKAWESKNGFTGAQTALNIVEMLMYLVYLWMIWRRADKTTNKKEKKRRTVSGRSGALAVLIGFSAAVMTLSKTVLYCKPTRPLSTSNTNKHQGLMSTLASLATSPTTLPLTFSLSGLSPSKRTFYRLQTHTNLCQRLLDYTPNVHGLCFRKGHRRRIDSCFRPTREAKNRINSGLKGLLYE